MGGKAATVGLRVLLFIFGMVVLVLGLIFLMPHPPAGTPAATFITCDLIVLYALFFGSFLLGDLVGGLSGGRIVSMGIFFKFLIAYVVITAVLVFLAATGMGPSLTALVIIQLVALFGLAIGAYLSLATSTHINDVQRYEAGVRGSVDRLRATSQNLCVQTSRLNMQDQTQSEIARATNRIAEELKYLSPVHTPEAYALEEQIASCLDALVATTAVSDMSSAVAQESLGYAQRTLMLIDQRKLMRSQ